MRIILLSAGVVVKFAHFYCELSPYINVPMLVELNLYPVYNYCGSYANQMPVI